MKQRVILLLTAALVLPLCAKPTVSKKFPGAEAKRAAPVKHEAPAKVASKQVDVLRPTPRPVTRVVETPEPPMDLSKALPGKALAGLPSSAEQLQKLSTDLKQGQPQLATAKEKSDALNAEALALRKKLIETAARIETLERTQIDAQARIAQLTDENRKLSAGFANDRVAVTKLLGVLERLQHDMPPALAMRPDDALGAARGAMLIGASLPPVYAQAAALSRRIEALKRTRAALEIQQREAADTSARLTIARKDLDQLLGEKEREAQGAQENYDTLKTQMVAMAQKAADFQALAARVRQMRQAGPADQSVVTVTAQNAGSAGGLDRNSLLEPVVGTVVNGAETGNPGLSYATRPLAQVITPADGKVLYAGPYHKSGQVLILEITTGYDVVLAGLGRVTVKPNDQLLAGEPVGTMPADGSDQRLYFEVRHGGHGLNPSPWLKLNLRPAFGKANRT